MNRAPPPSLSHTHARARPHATTHTTLAFVATTLLVISELYVGCMFV